MATITALASNNTGSTFNSLTNIANAYTNTSSTTYAQLNTPTKTTGTYVIYFTGFDFSAIPSNATINSVIIKAKGRVNSTSYISSATIQACKGTTLVGSSSSCRTTTATTYTLTSGTWSRADLDTMRILWSVVRSNNKNNAAYAYVYGMEVTVDYSEAVETVTVTSSLNGAGSITPNGATVLPKGSEYSLTINPTSNDYAVSAMKNGTDITGDLVRHSGNPDYYAYSYIAEEDATIAVKTVIAQSYTIKSSLAGDGTINPSGTTTLLQGQEYLLTITPTNKESSVSITKDGVNVTSDLEAHGGEPSRTEVTSNLGEYNLLSGGFNGAGASYFQGLVGKGVDNTKTSSNYYSSSNNTQAKFTYAFDFSSIPSNATITEVYVLANGHPESTSQAQEYMCIQLKSGTTYFSDQYNWKSSGSTSNSTYQLNATTIPTVAQIKEMVLECTLGYYGGALNGATCYVTYTVPGSGHPDYYTYRLIVSGNSTIVVTIGETPESVNMFRNGTFTPAAFYVGSQSVSKIYLGDILVYERD